MLAFSRTHMAWGIANRSPTWIVRSKITINSISSPWTTKLKTSLCRDSLLKIHQALFIRISSINFNPAMRKSKDICSNNNMWNSKSWHCSRKICKSRCNRWKRRLRQTLRNRRNRVDGSAASLIRQLITRARIWFLRSKRLRMKREKMVSNGIMIWTSTMDSLIFMTSSMVVKRSHSRRMGCRLRKRWRNSRIVRLITCRWNHITARPVI